MTVRIDRIVTSGVFSLDGQDFAVDNNVWLVGNDREVLVIDAAHDAEAILEAVGSRTVKAIVSTHGHNDHVNAAPDVARATGAPVLLHRDDLMLWQMTHPNRPPDEELTDGDVLSVAGSELRVLHTPGHSPGGVCLYAADLATVFSGDTLFKGGPGATGRSYSDLRTLLASIRRQLLTLPRQTVVRTGHGDNTRIDAEAADELARRGS